MKLKTSDITDLEETAEKVIDIVKRVHGNASFSLEPSWVKVYSEYMGRLDYYNGFVTGMRKIGLSDSRIIDYLAEDLSDEKKRAKSAHPFFGIEAEDDQEIFMRVTRYFTQTQNGFHKQGGVIYAMSFKGGAAVLRLDAYEKVESI